MSGTSVMREAVTQQVRAYQAVVLKNAIVFYVHTGSKVNRDYTPTNMQRTAEKIDQDTIQAVRLAGHGESLGQICC